MAYQLVGDRFVPLTGNFERPGGTNFYLTPHWELTLKPRLRFALVDRGTQRILDYVNLADCNVLDVADVLDTGGQCGEPYYPNGSNGSMWCTNRMYGAGPNDIAVATFGINNQISASMGGLDANWQSSTREFPPGMDRTATIDFFRAQFGASPLSGSGGPFSLSNSFNAPFQPFRNIYLVTSWQANDPLVHYMLSDLLDLVRSNLVVDQFSSTTPRPTDRLGWVSVRFEPWGGGFGSSSSTTKFDLRVKDPLMLGSDYWHFPTNSSPNLNWLGRVHRGTPWQTIYLKAPGASLATWVQWTGNTQLVTNSNGQIWEDAFFTQPTNDWRLASLVISLLNTNDPHNLASVNQPGVPAWSSLLDGMTVLTNYFDDYLGCELFNPVIMSSNSPQAAIVAAALNAARASQPNRIFRSIGDLLAIPELSTASPWLDTNGAAQLFSSMNDEACEAIPSQLLPMLRPESIGAVSQSGGTLQVQFSGADGYGYVVQTSSNLLSWTSVSTNYPANGSFNFVETPPPSSPRRFYRSVLWP